MKIDSKTLLEASGYRIPPFRLARITDVTNKIMKLILCCSDCAFTAEEARLILRMAESFLEEGTKEWN